MPFLLAQKKNRRLRNKRFVLRPTASLRAKVSRRIIPQVQTGLDTYRLRSTTRSFAPKVPGGDPEEREKITSDSLLLLLPERLPEPVPERRGKP